MVNVSESSINVIRQDEPKKLNGSSQHGTRRSLHLVVGVHGQRMRMAERWDLNQPC